LGLSSSGPEDGAEEAERENQPVCYLVQFAVSFFEAQEKSSAPQEKSQSFQQQEICAASSGPMLKAEC
jgi:hypothetical protein